MSAASKSSPGLTSPDTGKCISSPASPDGPTLSISPDGQQRDLFGQVVIPANPSARLAREKAKRTKDTSGRCSFGSSESASLQRSLVNRLLLTTDTDGSPEYEMTWKKRAMQSGAPICRLAARARRTSGKGCSGWPTPNVPNGGRQAKPESMTATGQKPDGRKGQVDLNFVAQLAGWPTPDAQDFGSNDPRWEERREEIKAKGINGNGFGMTLGMAATLTGWTTPQSHDAQGSGSAERLKRHGTTHGCKNLQDEVHLAGWATPQSTDGSKAPPDHHDRNLTLVGQAKATGPGPTSSTAETTSTAACLLNPLYSLWLQGYPAAWGCCAERAIASSRKSRRSSSGHSLKRKG